MQRCLSVTVVTAFTLLAMVPMGTVFAGPNDCVTWIVDLAPDGTRVTANADDTITLLVAAAKSGDGAATGIIIQPGACSVQGPDGQVESLERQAGLPNLVPSDLPTSPVPIPSGLSAAPSLP